jgi:hypothetical protein
MTIIFQDLPLKAEAQKLASEWKPKKFGVLWEKG